MADTSILDTSDNDLDAGFVFYENSLGMNFRYLKGLYDNEPTVLYEKRKHVNDKINELDTVIEHYLPTMYNNVDNQMLGVYGNTVITHDILTKKIKNNYYSYAGSLATGDDYSSSNRLSFMSANYDSHQSANWGRTSAGNKQLFDNYNLVLTIYGNSNITVGQTIEYVQDSNVLGSTDAHKVFPKKHLITNVKHSISQGTYTQTLELSSNKWYE